MEEYVLKIVTKAKLIAIKGAFIDVHVMLKDGEGS